MKKGRIQILNQILMQKSALTQLSHSTETINSKLVLSIKINNDDVKVIERLTYVNLKTPLVKKFNLSPLLYPPDGIS